MLDSWPIQMRMIFGRRLVPVKRICYSCKRYIRSTIDYSKNYYEILEVKRDATQQEIKNAFYMLSKKYHPDVTGGGPGDTVTERFLAVKEAYEVLKDVDSRRDYDTHRAQTSTDYTWQSFQSRMYNNRNPGYDAWRRSNRYAGSFRNTWPYSNVHLRRVIEEMRRRAEEYERVRREQGEEYWEKFYQAERERYRKRRRDRPARPSMKLAMDSWLSGPLLPYLPYLSAFLVIYMIGFFLIALYNVVGERKMPSGRGMDEGEKEREQARFHEMMARERSLVRDLNHIEEMMKAPPSARSPPPPAPPPPPTR